MTFDRPFAGLTGMNGIRWLMFGVLALGVLSLQTGRGTLAYFTSVATSSGNTFTSGSINLQLTDNNEGPLSTVTQSITATVAANSWRPGQLVTQPLTVSNNGTLPLTYGITYAAADSGTTPGGASATPSQFLTLAIKAKGTGSGTAADCTDAKFSNASFWQESIYSPSALATGSTQTILPDTGVGSRTLAATSGSEVLCAQVVFTNGGAGVENLAQGGTSTVAFSFNGRQQ